MTDAPQHDPTVHPVDCPACQVLAAAGKWATATKEHAHSGKGVTGGKAPVA